MARLIIGVGDGQVTRDPESVLITYALGSCVAVAIYDPVAGVGGLLHFMLPESSLDPVKAQARPCMFADTGIPLLFRQATQLGAEKRRIVVRLAGGSQMMDEKGVFNIGKRNCLAARKILWRAGVMVQAEEVGGNVSRTVRLDVARGTFWLREAGGEEREVYQAAAVQKGTPNGI